VNSFAGILYAVWEWAKENAIPWVIVDDDRVGMLYLLGRAQWELKPRKGLLRTGLYLYVPLVCRATVVPGTEQIVCAHNKAVVSSSGRAYTSSLSVVYVISDAREFLVRMEDGEDSIEHFLTGAMASEFGKTSEEALSDPRGRGGMVTRIQNRLLSHFEGRGVRLVDTQIVYAPSRPISLMSG
jgi:hypothetical protein